MGGLVSKLGERLTIRYVRFQCLKGFLIFLAKNVAEKISLPTQHYYNRAEKYFELVLTYLIKKSIFGLVPFLHKTMFAPESEFTLLRKMLNRLFDRLEKQMNVFGIKQDLQEKKFYELEQRLEVLEQREDSRTHEQSRFSEIEHLVNLYSNDGEPICNYFVNLHYDDSEL